MASPEEIPNIEHVPVFPRRPRESAKRLEKQPRDTIKPVSLTTVKKVNVEFWHQGEKAGEYKPDASSRGGNYSKKADQFNLILIVIAVLLIGLTGVLLHMGNKKYAEVAATMPAENTRVADATVDFYRGNYAFSKKIAEERAAKEAGLKALTPNPAATGQDFEISLQAQIQGMNEKLKKMRLENEVPDAPPPPSDTGAPNPIVIKPTNFQNFVAPADLNQTLPKALQGAEAPKE